MSKQGIRLTRRSFVKGAAAGLGAVEFINPTALAYERSGQSCGWFDETYRLFHIDAHFGGFKTIYSDFDAESTAETYKKSGVQMLSYFSKCWAGYSYYPTDIGVVHPGLKRDFTGELTAALKKRGIRTILYFMLGMERRHQFDHPDWIRNEDPKLAVVPVNAIPGAAMMCFNSPYVDTVGIPQMKELIKRYDPDGFFIDIVIQQFMHGVCHCKYCREQYARDVGGELPANDTDPKAFAYRKWTNTRMEAFIEKVHSAIATDKPDIEIINNYTWMMRYPVTPPRFIHHVTWDTPVPKEGLFSWNFSLEARYLSTLPDITWSCMNTRGNTWGEYSLREPEAFMSECAILLASCGRTYVSDIPYPHGNPDPAVMKVFAKVNERTKALEPLVKNCRPVADTAILHSADSIWSKAPLVPTPTWHPGPAYHSVCGAHKALSEGHIQFGIVNSEILVKSLGNHRSLILPDQPILNKKECEAIRTFVKNGGILFATGETGIRDESNNPLKDFALADVFGVSYKGSSGTANCYLRNKLEDDVYDIPVMDIQIVGQYTKVVPTTAEVLMEVVPPYEGISGGTPPPSRRAGGPGVTMNKYGKGIAIYCAPQIFQAYYREDTPVIRKLAMRLFDSVYPKESRTLVCEKTPINVEVFYNERGSERFVHLVNYSGDKRERGVPQVQDFTTVHAMKISVETPKRPSSVTLEPEGKPVDFDYRDGRVIFTALPLAIHHVYRIA